MIAIIRDFGAQCRSSVEMVRLGREGSLLTVPEANAWPQVEIKNHLHVELSASVFGIHSR